MAQRATAVLCLGPVDVPMRMYWGNSVMSVGMATGVSPKASPVSPATAAPMAPSATHVIR